MKLKAYLHKWIIQHHSKDSYVLSGYIMDDEAKRFPNKSFIRTSKIVSIDFALSQAETLNTLYCLEEPAEHAHLTGNS